MALKNVTNDQAPKMLEDISLPYTLNHTINNFSLVNRILAAAQD